MNEFEQKEFVEAIALAREGQKDLAYMKIIALSKATGAKDPQLLLWLAFTTPDLAEAATAIRMAETKMPDSPAITQAYAWLRAEREKPKPPIVPPPPFVPPMRPESKFVPDFKPDPAVNPSPAPEPTPPPVPVASVPDFEPDTASLTGAIKKTKFKNNKRLIYTALFSLIGVVILVAGLFIFILPAVRDLGYTEYYSSITTANRAGPGDLVKFRAKLVFNQVLSTDEYDYYAWLTDANIATPAVSLNDVYVNPANVRAVFVRFPRGGEVRPSRRYTYYYGRILESGFKGPSVLVEPLKVDYTDKAELAPVYNLIQGKALKTIRAQDLPGRVFSSPRSGFIWISTDLEVLIPKDTPYIKEDKIKGDIGGSRIYLVSADPRLTGFYYPTVTYGIPRSEGDYTVYPATVIIEGPPDWLTLEWVGYISEREIKLPLKL